jgi:putative DNA methylase
LVKIKTNPAGQERPPRVALERMYEYRRKLPHYQPAGRRLFITFRKNTRDPFPPQARNAVLQHCLHDHGNRYQLHAAVVMPEHVHLLLTPLRDEKGWPYGLPAILRLLKGTSARTVNRLASSDGPVWQEESFDHVVRSPESFAEKLEYIRQNPVRRALAAKPEDYPWLWIDPEPCGTDTPVRRS